MSISLENANLEEEEQAELEYRSNTKRHNLQRTSFIAPLYFVCKFVSKTINGYYTTIHGMSLLVAISLSVFTLALFSKTTAILTLLLWAVSPILIATNGELTPDNAGIAYGFLGIGLSVLGCRRSIASTEGGGSARWLALSAGAFAYWAFSARINFITYSLPALVPLLFSSDKKRLLGFFVVGALGAFAAEVVFHFFMTGANYPLGRIKSTFMRGASRGTVSVFMGYDWTRMVTRFPNLLFDNYPIEFGLMAVGFVCLIPWVRRIFTVEGATLWSLIVFTYGFMIFGVTSFSPPVPILRAKVRYLSEMVVLLYPVIAYAFVRCHAIFWERCGNTGTGRRWRWNTITIISISVVVVGGFIYGQISHLKNSSLYGVNGKAPFTNTVKILASDPDWKPDAENVFSDTRSRRVLSLMVQNPKGYDTKWYKHHGGNSDRGPEMSLIDVLRIKNNGNISFVVLNYRRLNANYKYNYAGYTPPFEKTYLKKVQDLIMDASISGRTYDSGYKIDILKVNHGTKTKRKRIELTATPLKAWSIYNAQSKLFTNVLADEIVLPPRSIVFSGGGRLWNRPKTKTAQNELLMAMKCRILSSSQTPQLVRAYLDWWDQAGVKHSANIGRIYVRDEFRDVFLWGYLPQNALTYRFWVRSYSKAEMIVSKLDMYGLELLPSDTFDREGEAWR